MVSGASRQNTDAATVIGWRGRANYPYVVLILACKRRVAFARFPWIEQVCVPSHFSYRLEGRTVNVEISR